MGGNNHLNYGLVRILNGRNKIGQTPNGLLFDCHVNTLQMDPILFSYVLVQYANGRSSS